MRNLYAISGAGMDLIGMRRAGVEKREALLLDWSHGYVFGYHVLPPWVGKVGGQANRPLASLSRSEAKHSIPDEELPILQCLRPDACESLIDTTPKEKLANFKSFKHKHSQRRIKRCAINNER